MFFWMNLKCIVLLIFMLVKVVGFGLLNGIVIVGYLSVVIGLWVRVMLFVFMWLIVFWVE